MKLFNKKRFVWSEPWFFCQRVRGGAGWARAVLPGVLIGGGVAVLLVVAAPGGQPWWLLAGAGLALGLVVQFGLEAAQARREVSIDDDAIEAFGNAGQFTSHTRLPLARVTAVRIRRAEEVGRSFALLVVELPGSFGVIGVPPSVRLDRLARTLHEMNVPVTLAGWEPVADAAGEANTYTRPAGTAVTPTRVEEIPEPDRNLTQPADMIVALLMSVWPVFIWLGVVAWAGVYAYQNWAELSIWVIGIGAVGLFGALTIPFGYFSVIGDYLSARHLIRAAKTRVQQRGESLIRSFDEKVVSVELVRRDTWGSAAPKVTDFGFLAVEPDRRRVVFEGNRERWVVPFSAVTHCRIEEVQYSTAGESVTGELRCFVVLGFEQESGPVEVGLRVADKEPGKNTDTRRLSKAVDLFDYLTAALPAGK
ncbi:hypothetical protein J0H58_21795 [bacterium]|nr:hypothetical protein [bacterium]